MECSRIPAPDSWSELATDQVHEYREHLAVCPSCRKRLRREAPDELLYNLEDPDHPEEFWIGFWPSLQRKISVTTDRTTTKFRIVRWAAVIVIGALILMNSPGRTPHEVSTQPLTLFEHEAYQRPLVEDIQNPKATYYIFQSANNENIVMVFDPDLDL